MLAPGTAVASSQASEGEQSQCFPGAVETRGLRQSLAASILKTQESQTCVGGTVLQFLSGWWQRSAAPCGGHAIFSGGPVGTAFPRGVLKCVVACCCMLGHMALKADWLPRPLPCPL